MWYIDNIVVKLPYSCDWTPSLIRFKKLYLLSAMIKKNYQECVKKKGTSLISLPHKVVRMGWPLMFIPIARSSFNCFFFVFFKPLLFSNYNCIVPMCQYVKLYQQHFQWLFNKFCNRTIRFWRSSMPRYVWHRWVYRSDHLYGKQPELLVIKFWQPTWFNYEEKNWKQFSANCDWFITSL